MNKRKKILSSLICGLILFAGAGIFVNAAYGGNSDLNVTSSNASGVTSRDPNSSITRKDDNDQNFYIKLTSLTNGTAMSFTSYTSSNDRVSTAMWIDNTQLNVTHSHPYNVTAYAGYYYYVNTYPKLYEVNVHAVGTYCP